MDIALCAIINLFDSYINLIVFNKLEFVNLTIIYG